MQIITRYLIKEVSFTLLAVTPILLLIFLSNRLVQYLTDAASGKFPGDIVFSLLGLKSITVLAVVLPLVFFLSIILALGRLYKDSEMTALAACAGVGPPRVIRIMLIPATFVTIAVAILSIYVGPWAYGQSNQIKDRAEKGSELSTIIAGRFKESSQGDHIFYAETLSPDGLAMKNVFIQSRQHGRLIVSSSAKGTKFTDKNTGDQFLLLEDGNRYEFRPDHTKFKTIQYEKYSVRIQQKEVAPADDERNAKPLTELLKSSKRKDIAEVQWRFSMPVSALLLALLGVLLARTTPRQGRYAKLFVAILAYIAYNNLMGVARSWIINGVVPPVFGMWWVHVLMLLVIIVMFFRQLGVSWLFKKRRPAARDRGLITA